MDVQIDDQERPQSETMPFVDLRNAIVVDFISETQLHAETSIEHGWNGPWELPMGAVNTVYGRWETNEQNALIERHMLFLETAMTIGDFHRGVIEKLIDSHTCSDRACPACRARFSRGLAEAFQILADGTAQQVIHLFAKWQPSDELVAVLAYDEIQIRVHRLDEISAPDLEANRTYSMWDGTPAQDAEFLSAIWSPAWKAR